MNDPWNNTWGKWELQKMDDRHYYQMGSLPVQDKPALYMRILKACQNEIVVIRCRIEAMLKSPGYELDQQCECLEA